MWQREGPEPARGALGQVLRELPTGPAPGMEPASHRAGPPALRPCLGLLRALACPLVSP